RPSERPQHGSDEYPGPAIAGISSFDLPAGDGAHVRRASRPNSAQSVSSAVTPSCDRIFRTGPRAKSSGRGACITIGLGVPQLYGGRKRRPLQRPARLAFACDRIDGWVGPRRPALMIGKARLGSELPSVRGLQPSSQMYLATTERLGFIFVAWT